MKDLVEVLEFHMIAEEGFRFKKNQTHSQSSKIPYSEFKSQYKHKIKRMLVLCSLTIPKIFKDPEYKKYRDGYNIYPDWKGKGGSITPIEKQFPTLKVLTCDLTKVSKTNLNELSPREREAYDASVQMVLDTINKCAAKVGLRGEAIDNRVPAGYGELSFVIDCEYSGVDLGDSDEWEEL